MTETESKEMKNAMRKKVQHRTEMSRKKFMEIRGILRLKDVEFDLNFFSIFCQIFLFKIFGLNI